MFFQTYNNKVWKPKANAICKKVVWMTDDIARIKLEADSTVIRV